MKTKIKTVNKNLYKLITKISSKAYPFQFPVSLYKTDFEIYDERAADHQNIVLDLYIGITS